MSTAIADIKSVETRPAPKPKLLLPQVFVGDRVLWYRNADLNTTPFVADVMDVPTPEGIVALNYQQYAVLEIIPVSGVRHRLDPTLNSNPNVKARMGCWDYLQSDPRRNVEWFELQPVQSAEEETPTPRDHIEEQIVALHRDNKEAVVIADTMGISHQRVNGVLRRLKLIS